MVKLKKELYTVAEAAKILGITSKTLRDHIKNGDIKVTYMDKMMISKKELNRYIQTKKKGFDYLKHQEDFSLKEASKYAGISLVFMKELIDFELIKYSEEDTMRIKKSDLDAFLRKSSGKNIKQMIKSLEEGKQKNK